MILEIEGAGTFRVIEASTFEHDIATTNALRSSGAERAMLDALAEKRDVDHAIFETVLASGKLFELLGCLLIPEGIEDLKWTAEVGRETAAKLRAITSAQAKQLALQSVVELIKAFFLGGLASFVTSRKFSRTPGAGGPDGANGAIMTSATGA